MTGVVFVAGIVWVDRVAAITNETGQKASAVFELFENCCRLVDRFICITYSTLTPALYKRARSLSRNGLIRLLFDQF
jgi:hypothetical protein